MKTKEEIEEILIEVFEKIVGEFPEPVIKKIMDYLYPKITVIRKNINDITEEEFDNIYKTLKGRFYMDDDPKLDYKKFKEDTNLFLSYNENNNNLIGVGIVKICKIWKEYIFEELIISEKQQPLEEKIQVEILNKIKKYYKEKNEEEKVNYPISRIFFKLNSSLVNFFINQGFQRSYQSNVYKFYPNSEKNISENSWL